ncbi:hypothetical protein ACJJTC_013699 [Scirpophaga incertulas]
MGNISEGYQLTKKAGGRRSWLKLFVTSGGGGGYGGIRRANKAFRESLRTLIDAISLDAKLTYSRHENTPGQRSGVNAFSYNSAASRSSSPGRERHRNASKFAVTSFYLALTVKRDKKIGLNRRDSFQRNFVDSLMAQHTRKFVKARINKMARLIDIKTASFHVNGLEVGRLRDDAVQVLAARRLHQSTSGLTTPDYGEKLAAAE